MLDAAPQFVIPAKVTFVADVAQFTPKTVETAEERQKLTFRIKAHIHPELLKKYIRDVKTGLPGVAYVQLDPQAPVARPSGGQTAAMSNPDANSAGPPQPAPVARLTDVSLRYGKTHALDAITLDLPAGCMVGLIGPDGVGKSSLMALVAGARRIQQGRVEVLGGDMADAGFRRAACPRIAYMPQGLGKNLYPTLSVFENADFFARLFGLGRSEAKHRIAELLDSIGLGRFPDRPAGKLSGGMKQKLCLVCALIHDPDLLILDEPTTGVDPLSRRQFWELVDRIRADRPGMSVLVSTAYMEEAARFDYLVAMFAGKVVGTGTPAELPARTGTRSLEEAFIALLPEEMRQRAQGAGGPPAPAGRPGGDHRGARPDPKVRRFRRGRSRQHADRAGGDLRLPRRQRLRQIDDDEDAVRPAAGHRRAGLAVRRVGRCQRHQRPPQDRLHVAGLLALLRADGAAEPGPARPAL